jgi:hypothetical protein
MTIEDDLNNLTSMIEKYCLSPTPKYEQNALASVIRIRQHLTKLEVRARANEDLTIAYMKGFEDGKDSKMKDKDC